MKTKTSTRIPWYKIDIFLLCYNFKQMVLGNVKKSTSISFVPYFNTLRDLNLNNLFLSLASNNKLLWIFVKYVRYDEYLQLSNITTYSSCIKTPNWCFPVCCLYLWLWCWCVDLLFPVYFLQCSHFNIMWNVLTLFPKPDSHVWQWVLSSVNKYCYEIPKTYCNFL